jgi:hypothetical protein
MTYSDSPHYVGEQVHLLVDFPNLGLQSGEVGSVCSIWTFDNDRYEVEFRKPDQSYGVRAIVMSEQIQAE